MRGHSRVALPARRDPGEELGRDVAQVVRARAGLVRERGQIGLEPSRARRVEVGARAREHAQDHGAHAVADEAPVHVEAGRGGEQGLDVLARDAVRLEERPQIGLDLLARALAQAGVGDRALKGRVGVFAVAHSSSVKR